jgi:hypothetical protein
VHFHFSVEERLFLGEKPTTGAGYLFRPEVKMLSLEKFPPANEPAFTMPYAQL